MAERVTFAGCTFDRAGRVLDRAGETVPLVPKAAEALALLLAEPGSLVTKETLRASLWPEGFVEEGNLTQTIYLLRKALDPEGDGRGFVQTVPRRGYRFVAPVAPVAPPQAPLVAASPPRRPAVLFRRAAALAMLVVAALGLGAIAENRGSGAAPLQGEAARAYARGRYYWNQRSESGLRASIAEFEHVVALAPRSALGYVGLADAHYMVANWNYPKVETMATARAKAERYANEALARDPSAGEALATLGFLAVERDHDLVRGRSLLERALALRPQHATAHEFYGLVRLYAGDLEASLAHFKRAVELDPTSSPIVNWYGIALYYAGRYDEARVATTQAIGLNPNNADARFQLILIDERLGRFDEAGGQLRELARSPKKRLFAQVIAAQIAVNAHRRPASLPNLRPHRDEADWEIAALCVALGRRADAVAWLDLSLRDPDKRLQRRLLGLDPRFAPLRGDLRFRSLTS